MSEIAFNSVPNAEEQLQYMERILLSAFSNSEQRPIKVFAPYSTDGMCAAYQIDMLARQVEAANVEYILITDKGELSAVDVALGAQCVFLGMGSNILERIGEDAIIIDNTPITDTSYAEKLNNNVKYFNPYSINLSNTEDSLAAVSLSEEVYEITKNISLHDNKRSMEIATGIGAVSHHGDKLNSNPYSRQSIKKMVMGMLSSDNQNTDATIRQLITESGESKPLAIAQSIAAKLDELTNADTIIKKIVSEHLGDTIISLFHELDSNKDINENAEQIVSEYSQSDYLQKSKEAIDRIITEYEAADKSKKDTKRISDAEKPKDTEITLDDLLARVREIEVRTSEPVEATRQIQLMANNVFKAITVNKPTVVFTDYDADGICAAYQLDKLARRINPDIQLEVICNDRREAYGVPKFVEPKPDTQYIIFDMGCNELDYISEKFGDNTLVIDHHIIEGAEDRAKFNSKANLLDLHSLYEDDNQNPQYCATGLSYRIFEEITKIVDEHIARCNKVVTTLIGTINSHDGDVEEFEDKCRSNNILISASDRTKAIWDGQPCIVVNETISDKETGEALFEVQLAQSIETGKMLHSFGDVNIYLGHGNGIASYITVNEELYNPIDEKTRNTNLIMAGIGTVADVVNVLDENSHNREIIKKSFAAIDNADEQNTDYVIGYMLAKSGVTEQQVTSKKIGFGVAPFINGSARLSEIIGENGAQRMYNALTADPTKPSTFHEIDALAELNNERKNIKMQLLRSDDYHRSIDFYRCGGNGEDIKIAIHILPDNTPSSFCGLVASDLSDNVDKPAIVLTYNTEKGYYTGSARNSDRYESLKSYVDLALATAPEAADLDISYGGHHNAFGISRLEQSDLRLFGDILRAYQDEFKEIAQEQTYLRLTPSELSSPETLQKMLALEPTGNGNRIPPFIVEGFELCRDGLFFTNRNGTNHHWKDIALTQSETIDIKSVLEKTGIIFSKDGKPLNKDDLIKIRDWCYSPAAYPQDEANRIKFLASMELNDYRGLHIEAKTAYSHNLVKERYRELEHSVKKNKNNCLNKE